MAWTAGQLAAEPVVHKASALVLYCCFL